jgi:hypothetical protein
LTSDFLDATASFISRRACEMVAGWVFGISRKLVTPPSAQARLPARCLLCG